MANISGSQPEVKYCPYCKSDLRNVLRSEMETRGHVRKDGTIAPYTHTYICIACKKKYEINQHR
jgi:uncharacterized protein with PIN domain